MSESLERWRDDAPERFHTAKAAYAQLGPDAEQLERMLAGVEQAAAAPGVGAPATLRFGSKAWYWLAPVLSLVGAAWFWIASSRPTPAPAPPAVERAAPQLSTPAIATASDELPRDAVAEQQVASEPAVRAAAKRAPSPSTERASDPLAELALLERARRVIAKDPARALALTEEHRRVYAGGQFAEERELLAIEALVRLGRTAAAERRGSAFRRAHPSSVHAHRLGVILSTEQQ